MICKRCIMDSVNDPDLVLDEKGICNHCRDFDDAYHKVSGYHKSDEYFQQMVGQIKRDGASSRYDCIIGVSGGVDSTYLAYLAWQHKLRVLLVHFDNGWNSEIASKNIEKLGLHTGYDLSTYVINWDEMKDLQLSFFKAGVVDIELPYDYALTVTTYKMALKYNIKYVLSGHNLVTEGNYMPVSWRHDKLDSLNIKDIHRKFGSVSLKTFPSFSFVKQYFVNRKITSIRLLDYINYNKKAVKEILIKELGFIDYAVKHYENIFTRFYQGYILKEKFGIDKRQFHLSVLIQSGQITREDALREYAKPDYSPAQMEDDKQFVLKKLGFSNEAFDAYMKAPARKHTEYASIQKYWKMYFKIIRFFDPVRKLTKSKA